MSDEPDGTSPTQSPPEPRRPAMRMVALLGGIVGGLAVAAREREKDELEHQLAERAVGAPLKRARDGAWTLVDEPVRRDNGVSLTSLASSLNAQRRDVHLDSPGDDLAPRPERPPGADERDLREAEEKRRRRAEGRMGEERKRP